MDNLDTTNQTTDGTSVDTQPINNSTPVDNTQVTNENTTTPVNSSGTTSDNTTTETPKVEPTTGDNSATTPIEIPNYIEVYDYDGNGYYIGVDRADRSPEDKEEVVYLLPRNATKIKPPDIILGKIQKWNGATWEIVDRPKDVVINDEITKNNDEVISGLQERFNELETKIEKLEKLMTGVIVSKLKASMNSTTITTK